MKKGYHLMFWLKNQKQVNQLIGVSSLLIVNEIATCSLKKSKESKKPKEIKLISIIILKNKIIIVLWRIEQVLSFVWGEILNRQLSKAEIFLELD